MHKSNITAASAVTALTGAAVTGAASAVNAFTGRADTANWVARRVHIHRFLVQTLFHVLPRA